MRFEWDENKNQINKEKYGLSFEVAIEIFGDPLHLAFLDERYNYFEERWITIGKLKANEIIVVAHLYFDQSGVEVIRVISARYATKNERRQYEEL